MPEYYTLAQACGLLDLCHESVRVFIRAGQLRAVKMRGRIFIERDSVDALRAKREKPESLNWKGMESDALAS
jgi:excisionase family DNA binding protein